MNPWRVDVTLSHGRDLRRLRHNKSGRSTLAVVRGCPRSRYPTWRRAISGYWRDEDTIAECHVAENEGVVKARHARGPVTVRNYVELCPTWRAKSRLRFECGVNLHRR